MILKYQDKDQILITKSHKFSKSQVMLLRCIHVSVGFGALDVECHSTDLLTRHKQDLQKSHYIMFCVLLHDCPS